MKLFSSLNLALVLLFGCADVQASSWKSLEEGNREFVKNHTYKKQRKHLQTQNPSTVILSCSDSRVPPELIFDKGLGKLFVARVAGQVADEVVIDSIEYAIGHYDVDTLVVMGHTRCGAVVGALNHLKVNKGRIDPTVPGHLNAVLIPIERAIVGAGINIYAPNALQLAIRANISYVAKQLLANSPLISQAIAKGKVTLVGAEYNVLTGRVHKRFTFTKEDVIAKAAPFVMLPKIEESSDELMADLNCQDSHCACH